MSEEGDEKEMKRRKDGDLILMGQMDGNTKRRFNLFDGKFTTGFRVVEFRIADYGSTATHEEAGLLSTQEKSVTGFWDWGDVTEIGWAGYNAPNTDYGLDSNLVRPDNMIIEDLYLGIYSVSDNRKINYYIRLEKYEFTAWDGANSMVRNQSQAGPPA